MHDLDEIARQQVKSVVELLRDTLGEALLGVYLYGSAVHGGLHDDSDLDLFAVSARRTTEPERRVLISALLRLSRSRDHRERRHLEVTLVSGPDLRPWHYPPPMELQYGDWWRTEFEAGDMSPWTSPNPDVAVLLTMVRADGLALFGPPAATLFDPISRADLDRALQDVIPELLPGIVEDDTRNSLLTLSRIWMTLETGRIGPKDVAASWALANLPDGGGDALRVARAGYLGETTDVWDDGSIKQAQADADAMIAAIGHAGSIERDA